jgi:putative tryptophan/tyrosine transport system substrate-binding protein
LAISVPLRRRTTVRSLPRFCAGCENSAGSKVAILPSSIAGRMEAATEFLAEFVRLKVDVIHVAGNAHALEAKRATSVIPIVFAPAGDPVGTGLVASLARPGGNVTGLSTSTKLTTSLCLRTVPQAPGRATSSCSEGLEFSTALIAPIAAPNEVSRVIESFARQPAPGMIVLPGGQTVVNREIIADLAARHRVPAIYPYKYFAVRWGLASYGSDLGSACDGHSG